MQALLRTEAGETLFNAAQPPIACKVQDLCEEPTRNSKTNFTVSATCSKMLFGRPSGGHLGSVRPPRAAKSGNRRRQARNTLSSRRTFFGQVAHVLRYFSVSFVEHSYTRASFSRSVGVNCGICVCLCVFFVGGVSQEAARGVL